MVVNQNWDLLGRIGDFWKVKPGTDLDSRINDDVLGGDPGGRVSRSRGELGAEVPLNKATFVDADAREGLVDELLVDLGRRDDRERGDRGGGVGVGVRGGHGGRRGGEERSSPEPEAEEEEREENDEAGSKATEVEKERLGH